MICTKEVSKKFGITRQTINNYINKGLLTAPEKDSKNRYKWTQENINQLASIVNRNDHQLKDYNKDILNIQNRRYLGSKFKLLDFIESTTEPFIDTVEVVADLFAGTGVVADLFAKKGKKVIVNDILYSNYISYITWFGNQEINYKKVKQKIDELNQLQGLYGYCTRNFGNKYFSNDNAMKIDAIREKINSYTDINKREEAFLLTSLLYAADKIANTVGHYDAYRKKMDSLNPIHLKVPKLNTYKENLIYNQNANELVKNIKSDLVYIDTPYNSRGYENAYHVLENIITWTKPEVEGISKKAVTRKQKASDYNKKIAPLAFNDLITNIKAKYILVSYNNMAKKGNSRSNAKISNEEIISTLEKKGKVSIYSHDFQAFTTGKSKIDNHKELLYLCEVLKNE
ncbi:MULTISPECIES: DNA adenine methylase [Aerococcus]|uniref:DNA adenine methylase n=1 Tax=Aerococcus TaxID=1375 RepID=UPI001E547FCF|nr:MULTISPECIES: DNA adenine methylase [Aerococcus]MCY3067573.1 DNA adenine methylase [Aerococcus mictus]MCY3080892.1 DNA adenine methylase [Aerococcus mictus]MDK8485527.1 DNA adenine methylase [Aerococcus urinae]